MATFQASVDRNPVAEGESLTLTLKSDESLDEDPDLSVLQKDFDVLGQSQGSSIQIINGKANRSVQWQISIIAKHSGPLVIPSIKAGGQATQPIVLGVNKANPAKAAQQGSELFLEISAEPRTVYVQQQIIFTVSLYRAVDLGNGSTLSDPKFPGMDAAVERLGDDHSFQTIRNGLSYAVIERRYAVYPQKSGQFTSAPVQFDGEVVESNRGGGIFMFDPFSQSSHHKRVNSGTISFTVKPVPAGMGGAQWLPAGKLELTEQWSDSPPKFTAGEPVTRTLVLSATGLSAAQLPTLDSGTIDGLKFYPDQPVLKDNKDNNGISGVRTQKIAILPTRSGSFILPAMEVKWWNVNTDKMEVARLPEKIIKVLPGSTNTGNTNQVPELSIDMAPSEKPDSVVASPGTSQVPNRLSDTNRGWWPWLSLFLGAGWLFTLMLWWWKARKKDHQVKTESVGEPQFARLEDQLKKCCMANDQAQAKSNLLAWAKLRWRENYPTSLTALAGLCEPALADALNELDRSLYAQNREAWRGESLWQLFIRHKPAAEAPSENEKSLKPLFLTK